MPSISRVFFGGILDYAGLFPPARLPMDEAFSRFSAHRRTRSGWLIARFVCPAQRLDELTSLMRTGDSVDDCVQIAALGSGGYDPPNFAAALDRDFKAMNSFLTLVGGLAECDVFEVRFPDQGDESETVDYVFDRLSDLDGGQPMPFFEVSLLGDWRHEVARGVAAIAAASHEIDPERRAGLKIRCGGLEAAAVPDVEAIAAAIVWCRDEGLPLKATQGLHHPLRHYDPTLGTTVHGFVNLVAAVLFAREHQLSITSVQTILREEDPAAFSVGDTGLVWRELEVNSTGIENGRSHGITSFGSCSFSEPRDDLAGLGWI
jgi:hypothetical protein